MIDRIGCELFGRYFVGGFNIDEVLKKGAELKRKGYKLTYNLLGEHQDGLETTWNAVQTTKALISSMDENNKGNVAIKPTLYGLESSKWLFRQSMEVVMDWAKEAGIELEFDAEAYKYVEDTFSVFSDMSSKFHYRGFVRQCVQAHLADIYDLMDKYNLWDKHLRAVEGSGVYGELMGRVITDPVEILERYCYIVRRNHIEGQVPYVATVCDRKKANAAKKILPSPHMLEFQMLYGPFGRRLGKELLNEGWQVRIYIPFVVNWCKDAWKDYGLRRSAMMRRLILREAKYKLRRWQNAKND